MKLFFRVASIVLALAAAFVAHGQSEPTLVSVTPADGATGVATNTTVMFVFDQDMNTRVFPFPSLPPTLIGNIEFQPKINLSGSWGADKRTLTIKFFGGLPYDTVISWTLNPPNETAGLPKFSGASGQALATVLGSFRTAAYVPPPPIPKLISVTPTNGATEVSPSGPVIFVFDQEMDTTTTVVPSSPPSLIGNYEFSSFTTPFPLFTGSWSADKRTLTFQPSAQLALRTTITWRLNPPGTTAPLKTTLGQSLVSGTGSYTTISDTGGNPAEICQTPTTSLGIYKLMKILSHRQTSANDVSPEAEAQAIFGAYVQSPIVGGGKGRAAKFSASVDSAGLVTNASIALPNGNIVNFESQFFGTNRLGFKAGNGNFILYDSQTTEAALDSKYPAGSYTMRFEQIGEPERVIPMNLSAAPVTVPMITNYDEAQAIDPSQGFILRWNSFAPQEPGAFIRLTIFDEFGKLIFQAPSACVPRTLSTTDTAIVIPPNYFKPGLIYNGELQFGLNFYNSTTDVPQMTGYGAIQRATSFILKTAGAIGAGSNSGPAAPAKFTDFHLLIGGLREQKGGPELTLSGTAGKSYSILRTDSVANPKWTVVGTVIMNASGTAVFDDQGRGLTFPVFYSAVSN